MAIKAGILSFVIAVAVTFAVPSVASTRGTLEIEDRYSAWNLTRPERTQTWYIILHTTESGGRSALEKLRLYGEAHYLVDSDGQIYRIIDKDKIAKHAGLSLWEGH